MVSFSLIVATLLCLYTGTFLVSLFKNYFVARKTGLPLIIVPIHPNHIVWLIISNPLRPIIKRYAPSFIYNRIALSIYGWEYHENRIIFRTLNTDTFMLVTCHKNELYTVNPEFAVEVFKRPIEFDKPVVMKEVADVFGPSLLSSVGEAWSRQRKLITTIINERISRVVFDETWRQSRAMVEDIQTEAAGAHQDKEDQTPPSKSKIRGNDGFVYTATFPSMKRIASNVLSYSAYGMPQEFTSPPKVHAEQAGDANAKLDMIECINIVISAILVAALVPGKIISGYPSFLPGASFMRRVDTAKTQYPHQVKKRLDDERRALKSTGPENARSNLTSMLIQASEYGLDDMDRNVNGVGEKQKQQQQRLTLTEDEIRGNLFVFTTAGFETTANALTYALVSLMAEPKWQDWIFEEIDELFAKEGQQNQATSTTGQSDKPDYAAFYPKAHRCLAVMMEVLRLHPPVIHLARTTPATSSVTVKTSTKTYHIPPDCFVYIPFTSLHCNPKLWRNLNLNHDLDLDLDSSKKSDDKKEEINETIEDVHAMTQDEYLFRPSRWINRTASKPKLPDGGTNKFPHTTTTTTTTLFQPPRGTYAPFSGGPRICPGQKMAQVEFVCVVLALFRDYRIEAVRLTGGNGKGEEEEESDEEVKARMKGVLRDSHAELTMVMERLDEVQVRFVKREKKIV